MPDEPEIRFESALAELETIVEGLQRGEPELDAALARYQKGVELLGRCYALLERAERSVSVLTGLDESGEPITSPFDPTATIDLARSAAAVAASQGAEIEARAEVDPDPPASKPRRKRAPKVEEPAAPPATEYDRFDPPF